MDRRWTIPLEHPHRPLPGAGEARSWLARGWRASADECWLMDTTDRRVRVALSTWQELRELAAQLPVMVRPQPRG